MYKKLLTFQSKVGAISKDSTNPFFKKKYFDINKLLSVIEPILSNLGLVLLQPLTYLDGKSAIKTMLIDAETGEKIEYIIPLPENSEPQKMGSIITYYRRYSLQSLLGLQAEDDDGNKASDKGEDKKELTISDIKQSIAKGFKVLGYSEPEENQMRKDYLGEDPVNGGFIGKDPVKDDYELLLKKLRSRAKNGG